MQSVLLQQELRVVVKFYSVRFKPPKNLTTPKQRTNLKISQAFHSFTWYTIKHFTTIYYRLLFNQSIFHRLLQVRLSRSYKENFSATAYANFLTGEMSYLSPNQQCQQTSWFSYWFLFTLSSSCTVWHTGQQWAVSSVTSWQRHPMWREPEPW